MEAGLEVLEDWLNKPLYKVEVPALGSAGRVTVMERGDEEEHFDEITLCPPSLVHHLRKLLFNKEKTGRFLFYFAKAFVNLDGDAIPSWFEFGAKALVELNTGTTKQKKRAAAEARAIRNNWRKHMAQYFIFQSKLLKFYMTAVDGIIVELKDRRRQQKSLAKWRVEVWKHPVFVEYIVRERWGAWDGNMINDDRWATCSALHPLHPNNQDLLGE